MPIDFCNNNDVRAYRRTCDPRGRRPQPPSRSLGDDLRKEGDPRASLDSAFQTRPAYPFVPHMADLGLTTSSSKGPPEWPNRTRAERPSEGPISPEPSIRPLRALESTGRGLPNAERGRDGGSPPWRLSNTRCRWCDGHVPWKHVASSDQPRPSFRKSFREESFTSR